MYVLPISNSHAHIFIFKYSSNILYYNKLMLRQFPIKKGKEEKLTPEGGKKFLFLLPADS